MAHVITLEDKEKLEEEFLIFLRETGLPEDSIFRGPCFQVPDARSWSRHLLDRFGKWFAPVRNAETTPCYADMAILDLESREYVALIEFRLQSNEQIENEMVEFFGAILSCLETKPPVFLVVPWLSSGFRIFQLRENSTWQELPRRSFPHYLTLTAGHSAEKSVTREVKQEKALDRFTITCHLLAAVLGLVAIASIGGLTALNMGQMSLLAFAALLVVAPHTLGFRFSREKGRPRLVKAK